MQAAGMAEQFQSATQMLLKTVDSNADSVSTSPLEKTILSKTVNGQMRHLSAADGIMGVKILSDKAPGISSREFTRSVESVDSGDTAEIVSKGGNIPDQYRRTQERRDNYLTTLIQNRVSERTNILQTHMQQQLPLKVTIGDHHHEIQQFGRSTGKGTLGKTEKPGSQTSSIGMNQFMNESGGRIQLNSVDFSLIKSSFDDYTRTQLEQVPPQTGQTGDRLSSINSIKKVTGKNSIALTQYAQRTSSTQVYAIGSQPEIINPVYKQGANCLQIDIDIKNNRKNLADIETRPIKEGAVIKIDSQNIVHSRQNRQQYPLKGVSVDFYEKQFGIGSSKMDDITTLMIKDIQKSTEFKPVDGFQLGRLKRPQALQLFLQSHDATTHDSSNMIDYSSRQKLHHNELYQANKDLTRLLVNPEQALNKNLKPIKTAYKKERAPLRSLFGTRQVKDHKFVNLSLEQAGRYSKRQSPSQVLKLSHDVKFAMNSRQNDFDLTSLHYKNITQLPAGNKFSKKQQIIDGLDTNAKLDLLRKSNILETLTVQNARASLEQIKEKIQLSTSENPLGSEYEFSTDGGELISIQSQDGFFLQPNGGIQNNTKNKQRNIMIGTQHKHLGPRQVKNPFIPAKVGSADVKISGGLDEPRLNLDTDSTEILSRTFEGIGINLNDSFQNHTNRKDLQSGLDPSANIGSHYNSFQMVQQATNKAVLSQPRGLKDHSWVFVASPSKGADTSRSLKKKHHEMLIDQIKALEQRVKDKKRSNEKFSQQVTASRNALITQQSLTNRIQQYETTNTMTLTTNFDNNFSLFNPSISTTQHSEANNSILGLKTYMSSSIDTFSKQSQVHNLYSRLISNDLESAKMKTQAQLSIERLNVEQAHLGVEELMEENKTLARNIKRIKELLNQKRQAIQVQQKKALEKEKAGVGRNSDLDSNSVRDIDGDKNSMISFSALGGGGYGSQRIDIKKVEHINQNLQLVLSSKTPFETMQMVLKTFKQALKGVARCTIFVINRYLQAYMFKDMDAHKRFFKAIQMDSRNSIVYAIYQDHKEYCKPSFNTLKSAAKPCFSQRLIYVPIFYDQLLMFAVQLESDIVQMPTLGSMGAQLGSLESQVFSPLKKSSKAAVGNQTSTVAGGSQTMSAKSGKPSQSRLSQSLNMSRHASSLRSLWNHNDFTVCKIIAQLSKARIQVFTYISQKQHKEQMKSQVIKFVQSFIQHRTFKATIRQIKTELPRLLGYSQAEVFMHDPTKNSLYCISSSDKDQLTEEEKKDFEREFIINEKSVVRFPTNMGISAYALRGDAVCFINNFTDKMNNIIGPLRATTTSSRGEILTPAQQAFIGPLLSQQYPFNKKIDNFMELESIENLVICSIQDEEKIGSPKPVGVLQLFNRVASDILQDDVERIHYIRKLIGSMMVKCEMYSISLELTVGMARAHQNQQALRDYANQISYGHVATLQQAIFSIQRRLEEEGGENEAPLKN